MRRTAGATDPASGPSSSVVRGRDGSEYPNERSAGLAAGGGAAGMPGLDRPSGWTPAAPREDPFGPDPRDPAGLWSTERWSDTADGSLSGGPMEAPHGTAPPAFGAPASAAGHGRRDEVGGRDGWGPAEAPDGPAEAPDGPATVRLPLRGAPDAAWGAGASLTRGSPEPRSALDLDTLTDTIGRALADEARRRGVDLS